jgi:hypothetical protein
MVATAVRSGIVIHTGAGTFTRASLAERRAPMTEAMTARSPLGTR